MADPMHRRLALRPEALAPRTEGAASWLTSSLLAAGILLWGADFAWEEAFRQSNFVHDDAFITLRYARNWAEGIGPVWNPGDRVEGFTSFVAVAGIALLSWLGMDPPRAALVLNGLGVTVFVATCAGVPLARLRGPLGLLAAAVLGAAALSQTRVLTWVFGRLEAPLYLGLLAAVLALWWPLLEGPTSRSRRVVSGLALGGLVAVRPDALVFVGVSFGALALAGLRDAGSRKALRTALPAALTPIALLLAFRVFHYDALLPNPVWTKAWGVPASLAWANGLRYVADYLADPPWIPLAAAFSGIACLWAARSRLIALWLLGAISGYGLGIASAGGDHMPAFRLALPILAPSLLLATLGLETLRDRFGPKATAAALVLTALFLGAALPLQKGFRALPPYGVVVNGAVVGRYLDRAFPPGTLVALNAAGATPYYAEDLRFLDMLGLNDRHIARRVVTSLDSRGQRAPGHHKGDGAYVLSREPDVIILGPPEGRRARRNAAMLGDRELARMPEFHSRYRMRRVEIEPRALPPEIDAEQPMRSLQFTYYERTP